MEDDRLQQKKDEGKAKMKEHKEVKKKEADAAILLSAPVCVAPIFCAYQVVVDVPVDEDVAAEDDSKPRTVSHEEAENDVAPPIYNVVHETMYFQFKENDQRQTSTLEYKAKLAEHAYGLEKSCMDVGLLLVDQWEKVFDSHTYMTDSKASQFEKESDQKRQKIKIVIF